MARAFRQGGVDFGRRLSSSLAGVHPVVLMRPSVSGGGIFAYTLIVYYLTLPGAVAIVCALIGWRAELGRVRWFAPLVGALLYVAALLLTFSLSTALGIANIAPVDLAAFLAGLAPGAIGFVCGWLLRRFRDSRR